MIGFAAVGGALLSYGLKESAVMAGLGGTVLVVGGLLARMLPDFLYEKTRCDEARSGFREKVFAIAGTRITNRKQVFAVCGGLALIVCGGMLSFVWPVIAQGQKIAFSCCTLFIFWLVSLTVLAITCALTYVLRDKV